MEDKLNNTPDEKEPTEAKPVYTDPNADMDADAKPVYTDPNADVTAEDAAQSSTVYPYTQSQGGSSYAGYQQNDPASSGQSSYPYQSSNTQYQNTQSSNYQYQNAQNGNTQYQDNLNYNISNNMGYNQDHYQDMDTSPMSMGDWLLTILAGMIPCAGIILYIVWAFGSTGNVNRRNFCRAQLIVMGAVMVLYLLVVVVFGMTYLTGIY